MLKDILDVCFSDIQKYTEPVTGMYAHAHAHAHVKHD